MYESNGKHPSDFASFLSRNAELSGGIFHEYFSHKNVSFWREKNNLLLLLLDTEELRTLAMHCVVLQLAACVTPQKF